MITKYNTYNESVRDMMKPISYEKSLSKFSRKNLYNKRRIIWEELEDIYRTKSDELQQFIFELSVRFKKKSYPYMTPLELITQLDDQQIDELFKEIFYLKKTNESVRDLMTGKSLDDVKKIVDKLYPEDKLTHIIKYDLKKYYNEKELNDMFHKTATRIAGILVKNYDYYHDNAYQWALSHRDEIMEFIGKGWALSDIVYCVIKNKMNESVRDLMTPKPLEEVHKILSSRYYVKPEIYNCLVEAGYKFSMVHNEHAGLGELTFEFYNKDINKIIQVEPKDTLNKIKDNIEYNSNKQHNESVRDKMTPIPKENREKALSTLKNRDDKVMFLMGLLLNSREEFRTKDGKYMTVFDVVNNMTEEDMDDVIRKQYIKESVRDKMTPKSEEDILNRVKDYSPEKIFDLSFRMKFPFLLKYAIEKGASPELENDNGVPYFILACIEGLYDFVKIFIEEGVDINMQVRRERTPLIEAVYERHKDVVKLLLDNGADVNILDDIGSTAIFHSYDVDITKMLIEHGADINAKDKFGRTALYYARELGYSNDIIELLQDNQ